MKLLLIVTKFSIETHGYRNPLFAQKFMYIITPYTYTYYYLDRSCLHSHRRRQHNQQWDRQRLHNQLCQHNLKTKLHNFAIYTTHTYLFIQYDS